MIRALRQRHRRTFAVLTVVLPAAFAVGIVVRKPIPRMEFLPEFLAPKTSVLTASIWSRDDLFAKAPVRVVLSRERAEAGRLEIQLSAPARFAKPDLLVYWTPGNSEVKDKFPDDAVLLGVFNGSAPLQLPSKRSSVPGSLILYSLADGEIVDVSKPISFQ